MNNRELKKQIKKISNVELNNNNEVIIDDYTKKEYKSYKNRLTRLENKYDIDLTKYKDKLNKEYSNLKQATKKFNKENPMYRDLDDIEEFNYKFNDIKELIRDIDPSSKSKPFKKDAEDLLKLSQEDNYDISDVEIDMVKQYTDLSVDEIEEYLYPSSRDEKSYYDDMLKPYLDDGMSYEQAKSLADFEWAEYTKSKVIDDINDKLPDRIKNKLDITLKMRLINLGE